MIRVGSNLLCQALLDYSRHLLAALKQTYHAASSNLRWVLLRQSFLVNF